MTDEIAVREGYKLDVTAWNAKAILAEKNAGFISVTDDKENAMAADSLSEIKSFIKEVEDARKNEVEPFNKLVTSINDVFRPISDRLKSAEAKIKQLIKDYATVKENERKRIDAERQKEFAAKVVAEQELAKQENRVPDVVVPPPTVLPTETTSRGEFGKTTMRTVWKWKLIDEKKVPDEYFLLDEKKINGCVRSGVRSIPGIEIYSEKEVSAR